MAVPNRLGPVGRVEKLTRGKGLWWTYKICTMMKLGRRRKGELEFYGFIYRNRNNGKNKTDRRVRSTKGRRESLN